MDDTQKLAESIHEKVRLGYMTPGEVDWVITDHLRNAVKLLTDIQTNSLNEEDKAKRIIDFNNRFGTVIF